jgi:hypothetical protein
VLVLIWSRRSRCRTNTAGTLPCMSRTPKAGAVDPGGAVFVGRWAAGETRDWWPHNVLLDGRRGADAGGTDFQP